MKRRAYAALAALVLATVPASADDASWSSVVEAAKREGTVVLYSALGGPEQDAVRAGFEKKYGIKVDLFQARGSEVAVRLRAEQAAGRFLADVQQSSDVERDRQQEAGMLAPIEPVPNHANLQDQFPIQGSGTPTFLLVYAILANTRLVPPGEEPKSWLDLLDPKWKGKLLTDDPSALGAGNILFEATYRTFGRDFQEKLATQGLTISRNNVEDARRIARGEFPLYYPQLLSRLGPMKGLPVKVVVPNEGASYVQFQSSILRNAPHPNAARLFINYLLDEDAQLQYANGGNYPVIKGLADKVVPEMKPYLTMKLLGTGTRANADSMLKQAAEIYKR